jgi:hypothetical protein
MELAMNSGQPSGGADVLLSSIGDHAEMSAIYAAAPAPNIPNQDNRSGLAAPAVSPIADE